MMNRRNALRRAGQLAGAAVLTPSLLTLLQSCQAEPRIDWEPRFLTVPEAGFLAAFIDTVLPRTETPGGLDVKADIFLDRVFAESYDAAGQKGLRAYLAEFNASIKKDFGANFVDLNETDRAAALQAAETVGGKFRGGVWGTAVGEQKEPISFYRSLKSMAVWAYLSSEQVGTEVLSYDPIPGEYDGCVPLEEVGAKWSL